LERIRKKLDILVEEKTLLDEEIAENSQLGDEVRHIYYCFTSKRCI